MGQFSNGDEALIHGLFEHGPGILSSGAWSFALFNSLRLAKSSPLSVILKAFNSTDYKETIRDLLTEIGFRSS